MPNPVKGPTGKWRSAALVMALLSLTGTACAPAEGPPRSYSFSHMPTEEVLTAAYRGGYQAFFPTYHFFGDGRLVVTLSSNPDEASVYERLTMQLPEDHLVRFLDLAVTSGILDVDPVSKLSQLAAMGRAPAPRPSDSASLVLSLRLSAYFGPSNPTGGPVDRRIVFHAPRSLATQYPEVPEFKAIGELNSLLTDLLREARTGDRKPEP